ncbi:glycosyltransferase family 4 protein [Albibacillus kandeliae]|uniref:glycosyltransferase family 4 protein n=1 Tax=Albibacillus kandeliae TaxID=2174228 RepID=UPI001E5D1398|nr:glycosyltransferase family 4 protein [Albibacillus kandeliae]
MKLAFYAPMKPPGHPTPSGDRAMARNLMLALGERETVSDLRLYDPAGDAGAQDRLFEAARDEAARLVDALTGAPPQAWVTYHNYYKAPDLVGPAVCKALNLPYVLIEATRAKSRLTGPWARFASAAEAASDAADLIFYLTEQDRATLERDRPAGQDLRHLHPFLPLESLPSPAADAGSQATLLAVGMMRQGDKLASYRVIAEVLGLISHPDWRLEIVGDGDARDEIAALMAPYGDRVRQLGRLDGPDLAAAYARAAAFVWPGVNEAYGMVYLEAQAAGLPVVAQDRPGVRDVLATPGTPLEDGAPAVARRIDALLADRTARQAEGERARAHVAAHHLLPAARETLLPAIRALAGATA